MTAERGRIPFRLRIGVTGNRRVRDDGGIADDAVRRVRALRVALARDAPSTPIELAVVTQLAEGPDRFVAQRLREEGGVRLEVVLPADRGRYPELQAFDGASLEEYERLLGQAASVTELESYAAASAYVVERCDVLVAVWDGQASGARGGAADTVARAAARHVPCISIVPDGTARDPADHLLTPLRRELSELDEFNRRGVDADTERLGLPREPGPELERAAALAAWYQRRFLRLSGATLLLALGAAVLFAISVAFDDSHIWGWLEAASLAGAGYAFLEARRGRFHERWLSCRLLTERLRSAHYLAPTGADFRAGGRLEGVYVGSGESEWIVRAGEEAWDGRRPAAPAADEELRSTLALEWIGGQLAYHERSAEHHRTRAFRLEAGVFVLYVVTLAVAILHALGAIKEWAEFLAIVLPAIAASIGAVLTIRQHRALSQRSEQMLDELRRLQADITVADSGELPGLAANAARVIAQETGDWLGAMWFLEMEHL